MRFAALRKFPTTEWQLILAARRRGTQSSARAVAHVCEAYWYPLYAYLRSVGRGADEAEDLTQAFFTRLIEKRLIERACPDRGSFRSFLITSLKNFVASEGERSRAMKRGGTIPVSWRVQAAELRYGAEPRDDRRPDRIYEQRWAATLLDRVLTQLRDEFDGSGKANLFETLKCYLTPGQGNEPYGQLAGRLHMSEGAVGVAVHRIRQRYRQLLWTEVARTIAGPEDEVTEDEVRNEIRYLFSVMRS